MIVELNRRINGVIVEKKNKKKQKKKNRCTKSIVDKNPGRIEKNPGPKINQNYTFQKFLQPGRQINGLILSLYQ